MVNHLRKGIVILSIALFFIHTFFIPVSASGETQRIYDDANLLTQEETEKLESLAKKYSEKRETDFIILTTKDENVTDVKEYMQDQYDLKGFGYDKSHGNTAILTIDMHNREIYLAGFYKGKTYLDNERLDLIRDKITPKLTRNEYYGAMQTFLKTGNRYMGIKPGVDPNNPIFSLWVQLLVSLGLAGVIVLIMGYHSGGRMTTSEDTYRDTSTSRILNKRDQYIRTTTTKRKKPSDNNSSGGGFTGGGGGGVTRGGHSHSGSRGSF